MASFSFVPLRSRALLRNSTCASVDTHCIGFARAHSKGAELGRVRVRGSLRSSESSLALDGLLYREARTADFFDSGIYFLGTARRVRQRKERGFLVGIALVLPQDAKGKENEGKAKESYRTNRANKSNHATGMTVFFFSLFRAPDAGAEEVEKEHGEVRSLKCVFQLFFGRLMLEREGGSWRGFSGQLCFG